MAPSFLATSSIPYSSSSSHSSTVVRAALALTTSATVCIACHVAYSTLLYYKQTDQEDIGDVEVFAKDTTFNQKALKNLLTERPWGLINSHLGSLSAQFRPSPYLFGDWSTKVVRRQERIALPIGDSLDVEFVEPRHLQGSNEVPLILLLHGINGHSTEPYIEQAALQIVVSKGWRCVILNYSKIRVLCHMRKVVLGGSNFMDSGDLNFLISHLRIKHHGFMAAVGFSMGGAKLIQYVGRTGIHSNLDAACCVSSPLDFTSKNETVWRANSVIQRLYHLGMSSNLKWWILRNYRALKSHPKLSKTKPLRRSVSGFLWWFQATRVTDFDEAITIHAKGYQDLNKYYSDATAIERLRYDVRIPILCITAKNDPFIPAEIVPGGDVANDNENVVIMNTRLGGHIGYWLPGKGCWATRRFLSFFSSVQEHHIQMIQGDPECAHPFQTIPSSSRKEFHRQNSLAAARNLQKTSSTRLTDYMQLVAHESVSSFGSLLDSSSPDIESNSKEDDSEVNRGDFDVLTIDHNSTKRDVSEPFHRQSPPPLIKEILSANTRKYNQDLLTKTNCKPQDSESYINTDWDEKSSAHVKGGTSFIGTEKMQ